MFYPKANLALKTDERKGNKSIDLHESNKKGKINKKYKKKFRFVEEKQW